MWWDDRYPFRRQLTIVPPPDGAKAGHPVSVGLVQLYEAGKVLDDGTDIEIVYLNPDEEWVVLDRQMSFFGGAPSAVAFVLQDDLDESTDQYAIYYGNHKVGQLDNPFPTRTDDDFPDWPVTEFLESANLTFTRPGEHWEGGESNIRGAVATFRFYGTKVRMLAQKGQLDGMAEIRIDGGTPELVDLFDYIESAGVVWTEEFLDPGQHEVRVIVTGQKNPSSSDYYVRITSFEYSKAIEVIDLGEQINDLVWSSVIGGS